MVFLWHKCTSSPDWFSGSLIIWSYFIIYQYMSRLMTKPTNVAVRPAKTQISLGIRLVWSVFAVRMKKALVLSYPLSAQRRHWSDWADAQADTLFRLDGCPGWSESSLGAQSLCCFCHVAAHNLILQAWKFITFGSCMWQVFEIL